MENVGKNIDYASEKIKEGKLVVFPTETVYGIGANAFNEKAVKSIFIAKNRPADNPLIVHVNSIDMAEGITKNITLVERKLMEMFWPGPLSIVLEKNDKVPYIVTAGLETVSVRMPDNKLALELIEKSGVPIAAPSANRSGKPSGTDVSDIYDELKDNVSYFIDGGESKIGIESTVVKVEKNGKIIVLRPGKITKEDLSKISDVEIDSNCFQKVNENQKVLSPGMKHRHYAPNAKCILIDSADKEKLARTLENLAKSEKNKKVAFMVKEEIAKELNFYENVKVYSFGESLEDVSKNIFRYLRKLDEDGIDVCYIESVEKDGLGLGIMNRILRACEYNILEV